MKTCLARTLSATALFGAVLVLGACATKTRSLAVGDPAAVQAAEDRAAAAEDRAGAAEDKAGAAEDRAAAAENRAEAAKARTEAAETALNDLRASLAAAQNALGSGDTEEQRETITREVATVRDNLKKLRQGFEDGSRQRAEDDQDPLAAADNALQRVDDALAAVLDVLGVTAAALGSGGGTISFASMHTSLDRAQTALNVAQVELK